MIRFERHVIAECDIQEGEGCWEETIINLDPGETINEAMNFLREKGWKFDPPFHIEGEDIACHCPWCNKNIPRQDDDLYLVEDEEL